MLQGSSRASVIKDSQITFYFSPLPSSTYLRILVDIHVHELLPYNAQKTLNLEAVEKKKKHHHDYEYQYQACCIEISYEIINSFLNPGIKSSRQGMSS